MALSLEEIAKKIEELNKLVTDLAVELEQEGDADSLETLRDTLEDLMDDVAMRVDSFDE